MAGMGGRGQGIVYALMTVGALAVATQCVLDGAALDATSGHYLDYLWTDVTFAAGMLVLATLSGMVAFAFLWGRLDAVRGTRASAQLLRSGRVIRDGVKVRVMSTSRLDDASMNGSQRPVLFFSAGRPWVCPRAAFACAHPEPKA